MEAEVVFGILDGLTYLPDKSLKGLACNNVPRCLMQLNSIELPGTKQWNQQEM